MSWSNMMQRCTNPKATRYPSYGARGVTVCDRWHQFSNFLADMGERPDGATIDRIDSSRGYEPDNCRWADIATQARNKRSIYMIVDGDASLTLREFALKHGLNRATLEYRYKQGWPVELLKTGASGKPSSYR